MKIALFYDWLNHLHGGAEKVLLSLLKLYPKAPVYTLVHDPSKTNWLPPKTKIITSFINQLPGSKKNPLIYTPFYDIALEQFDFSGYDIIISTTSTVGHCLLTPPSALFVCYFHNLNRHLYHPNPKYLFLKPLLNLYQKIDLIYSHRPDAILCNSQTVQKRLSENYQLPATVINPGIDTNYFCPKTNNYSLITDHYLVVSRLVPHKKLDLVVDTFIRLGLPLDIVGQGYYFRHLRKKIISHPNIKIHPNVNDHQLLSFYQNCLALICPQEEDYGIVALEAQACGKPVIYYRRGGIGETVINKITGLSFDHQTVESLSRALLGFQRMHFDPNIIRQRALQFSEAQFMLNFNSKINSLWLTHPTTIS